MTTSTINQAVLLVGGLGTRLRPLTYALPKALIPVANLPLIAYEIIPLVRAGVTRIIFAMGYKAELLREHLGDGSDYGAEFIYVEEHEKLDTAGAIKNVADYLTPGPSPSPTTLGRGETGRPFFCCNGDMIYDVDLQAFAADHLRREALATYCLRRTEDIQHFGLIQWQEDGRVTAFKEKVVVDDTGRNTVNSGFYLMSPEVLDYIPAGRPYSSEKELFPDLLARGLPLYAHLPARDDYWADVGRFDTYLQANGDVLEGRLSWFRPQVRSSVEGVTLAEAVDIQADVEIGAGAKIGPRVSIGEGAEIGAGAVIEDSIIWPGSRVAPGARVHRCILAGLQAIKVE
jgi:mannose-1-phosphate guanylyltransferase